MGILDYISATWSQWLWLAAATAVTSSIYLLYFYPASKFPGPKLAAVSYVPRCYHWIRGRYPWFLEAMLHKYGRRKIHSGSGHSPMLTARRRCCPSGTQRGRLLYDTRYANDNLKAFFPFSLGPRQCASRDIAWSQTRLFLEKVLWTFDLEGVSGHEKSFDKDFRVYVMWERPGLYHNSAAFSKHNTSDTRLRARQPSIHAINLPQAIHSMLAIDRLRTSQLTEAHSSDLEGSVENAFTVNPGQSPHHQDRDSSPRTGELQTRLLLLGRYHRSYSTSRRISFGLVTCGKYEKMEIVCRLNFIEGGNIYFAYLRSFVSSAVNFMPKASLISDLYTDPCVLIPASRHRIRHSQISGPPGSVHNDFTRNLQTSTAHHPQEDYYDLGSFHRPVTTDSKDAQKWFDRGFIWTFGFNHEEAAKCFEKAIAKDPKCAMAYWGLAYSLGPNYNKPWHVFDKKEMNAHVIRTHRAAAEAKAKSTTAFAYAMESVYKDFSDDLDVATLYAEAMMNLNPWQLWDLPSGKPAKAARTLEVKEVLDRALSTEDGLRHPGLLHLYIHLMEMSPSPEAALTIADHLRGLVPDSGHLNHMPSHLDIMCGDYRRAIASNSEAIRADERFVSRAGPLNFYTLYRSHDYHFRIYSAMFSGQSKIALETIAQAEKSISEELLRVKSPPMADWLEGFLGIRVHVLIRFGRWQDILNLGIPKDQELYCVTTAMIHYGKGVALAATGMVEQAEKERALFRDAVKKVPPSRTLFNNKCIDILAIAGAMLDGELAYRQGKFDIAFESLRKSIALDDALPYDEPWGWMQPTRHAYGALLLEQGHVEMAAAVYSADLGMDNTLPRALQHPNNVWSLHGYHECLMKLGRTAEACIVKPQLRLAIAIADVPIRASCFCRL
ncbi:hypothetical protein G7Y89_g4230 [Cudoniella acicularis]|uniref:Uncharacterized protein n=1 Tax=Cudoniella acicularis TaxID=354080 RepID=A0A8H4RR56_9HELO|nr:hypothetical protein G7Y89_g4230 [Cudoniella acicularis]